MKFESLPSDVVLDLPFITSGWWVYFLLDSRNEVVYVGRTTNLFRRLKDHNDDERKLLIVTNVKVISCRDERQMMLTERFYIDRYQPVLNTAGVLTTELLSEEPKPVMSYESARDIIRKWITSKTPGDEFGMSDLNEVRQETGYSRAWGYKVMREFEIDGLIEQTTDETTGYMKWIVTESDLDVVTDRNLGGMADVMEAVITP